MDNPKKTSIQKCLKDLAGHPGHEYRLGVFTPLVGYPLILSFSLFLLPLFLYMLFFNYVYFWLRKQKPIDRKKYVRYDRHMIASLSLVDKIWCEYCEWANGSLQWILAVLNEVEKRYCPIKNKENPHCHKVKEWRKDFLSADHTPQEMKDYYKNQYPKNNS